MKTLKFALYGILFLNLTSCKEDLVTKDFEQTDVVQNQSLMQVLSSEKLNQALEDRKDELIKKGLLDPRKINSVNSRISRNVYRPHQGQYHPCYEDFQILSTQGDIHGSDPYDRWILIVWLPQTFDVIFQGRHPDVPAPNNCSNCFILGLEDRVQFEIDPSDYNYFYDAFLITLSGRTMKALLYDTKSGHNQYHDIYPVDVPISPELLPDSACQ